MESELVIGDLVDEVDLIVQREGASERGQSMVLVVGLQRLLAEASNEVWESGHCSLPNRHVFCVRDCD